MKKKKKKKETAMKLISRTSKEINKTSLYGLLQQLREVTRYAAMVEIKYQPLPYSQDAISGRVSSQQVMAEYSYFKLKAFLDSMEKEFTDRGKEWLS